MSRRRSKGMNMRWISYLILPWVGSFGSQFVASSTPAIPDSVRLAQTTCSPSELNRSSPPFRCITPTILQCLKANNSGGGGSLDYKGGTKGEIVVKSNVAGTVALLGFQLDESSQTLNLNIKRKNPAVAEQMLWDGFRNTISQCRQRRR